MARIGCASIGSSISTEKYSPAFPGARPGGPDFAGEIPIAMEEAVSPGPFSASVAVGLAQRHLKVERQCSNKPGKAGFRAGEFTDLGHGAPPFCCCAGVRIRMRCPAMAPSETIQSGVSRAMIAVRGQRPEVAPVEAVGRIRVHEKDFPDGEPVGSPADGQIAAVAVLRMGTAKMANG